MIEGLTSEERGSGLVALNFGGLLMFFWEPSKLAGNGKIVRQSRSQSSLADLYQ